MFCNNLFKEGDKYLFTTQSIKLLYFVPELAGSSSASGLGGTSESDSIMQSSESDDEDEDSSPLLLSTISTTYTAKLYVIFI